MSPGSKAHYISKINRLVKYLVSIGITASSIELAKVQQDYVAYIFTDDEFGRTFAAVDNY